MISSNAELNRAIRNRSKEYTVDEIFSSRYLEGYMSGIITAMCQNLGRRPSLSISYNPHSNLTACTDGDLITCNSASPLIRELGTPYRMFLSLFGHIVHEMGHCLFTDFTALNPLRKRWSEDPMTYYPITPPVEGADEFRDYLNAHPNYRNLYVTEMCNLVNIMEDVYIENRIRGEFSGLATVGLKVTNDENYRHCPTEETLLQRVVDGKITELALANCIIHLKKMGYTPKSDGSITPLQKEVKEDVEECLVVIDSRLDELCWESKGTRRAKLLNEIFVIMSSLLPRAEANQDYECKPDRNKGNGSGEKKPSEEDRDLTEEEAEKLGASSKEMMTEIRISAQAQGTSMGITGKTDKEKAEEERKTAEKLAESSKSLSDLYEKAKKDIATAEIMSKDEEKMLKSLKKEASDIENSSKKVDNSSFSGFRILRESYFGSLDLVPKYNQVYAEVAHDSKSLARKIRNILKKDALQDEFDTGYMFGAKLNAKDLYRDDRKIFSRKNTPGDELTVCFGLLIDESGSMGGDKIKRARKAAIMMEDALRSIGIPLLVVGHTEERDQVILKPYTVPESHDGRDRYRLADISAYSGNIDGAAIYYMNQKLSKRPEDIKVLIVISDGLPAGHSYYSYDENEDTKMAVEAARKNGIRVFGAVIDDYRDVSRIYSDRFCFDCSTGQSLEKTLCMLIRKYVLINR